jgi:hypothetical protein
MDNELELVSEDELNELSEDELEGIANEVENDPNAISMTDVADLNDTTLTLAIDDDPDGPAIGKVALKTVSVPPAPVTAPGADVDPDTTMTDYSTGDDGSPDELFDRSDSVNLMGDHNEE